MSPRFPALALALVCVLAGTSFALADPGDDNSFADEDYGFEGSIGEFVSVGFGGHVVAGGHDGDGDLEAVRFDADGDIVERFGHATAEVGEAASERPFDALPLRNGKVVVVGSAVLRNARGAVEQHAFVLRFTRNGRLDPTFDKDGIVFPSLRAPESSVSGVVAAPGGKLLVAGYRDPSQARTLRASRSRIVVVRLTASGRLDRTYGGGDGVAEATPAGTATIGTSLARLADGKVVVGANTARRGDGNAAEAARTRFVVARFTSAGRLDRSFGRRGFAFADPAAATSRDGSSAFDVAVGPGGRIYIGGSTDGRTNDDSVGVARFTRDGRLDRAFGGDGMIRDEGAFDEVVGMVVQRDGRVAVGGTVREDNAFGSFGVARYTTAGRRDLAFGARGVATGESDNDEDAFDVARARDGSFLVVGVSEREGDDRFDEGGTNALIRSFEGGTLLLRISGLEVRARRTSVPVKVACRSVARRFCQVRLTLVGESEDFDPVRIGRRTFRLRSGQVKTVLVRLTRSARAQLRRDAMDVTAIADVTDGRRAAGTTLKSISILRG